MDFNAWRCFLNAAVFIKFFLIRVWYLMEGSVYTRAEFIYMPASPLLIFLKIFLDSSVVFNGGQHLYEGRVYLKFNLYLANNNMTTDYLNKKKKEHVLVLVSKVIF